MDDSTDTALPGPTPPEEPQVLFDATLHPHSSLSPRGFLIFMAVLVSASFILGLWFLSKGAWPIFGFYGLEVAIVYWAFRANYRSAERFEQVRLTEAVLTVDRADRRGRQRVLSVPPHWLRVSIDDPVRHESQVRLSSHGQAVVVGAFLSPEERAEFAWALRRALDDMKRQAVPRAPEPPSVPRLAW